MPLFLCDEFCPLPVWISFFLFWIVCLCLLFREVLLLFPFIPFKSIPCYEGQDGFELEILFPHLPLLTVYINDMCPPHVHLICFLSKKSFFLGNSFPQIVTPWNFRTTGMRSFCNICRYTWYMLLHMCTYFTTHTQCLSAFSGTVISSENKCLNSFSNLLTHHFSPFLPVHT